ncbi:MAG: DUF2855 family protein [Paracoccaceae bacterium]
MQALDLIVNRANLAEAEIIDAPVPEELADGQCLLQIDRFALTANNITYAVAPDVLQYWAFFPTDRDGWGRVPVWGFAEVVATTHPDVAVGARVYGYLPMSTHLVIEPANVSKSSMMDGAAHRRPMSPIYNQYTFTDADPAWRPEAEGLISLFRPLFTTAFLLDDLHRSNGCFGAAQVILSSASSKTAMALAHLLSQGGDVQVVGLTSAGNVEFVEGLGCYDKVLAYEDVETLERSAACYVDMAGNADLLRRVHAHFDDALKNSCRVGLTHWQALGEGDTPLPGPKPEFFFAPAYAQQRIAEWGQGEFLARAGAAWAGFAARGAAWVHVVEERGAETVQQKYLDTLQGRVDPKDGLFLSMWG